LFEVEYRHPWFANTWCITWSENWHEYREIEEVPAEQEDRRPESQNDENGNHTHPSELTYSNERNTGMHRGVISPPHRGPSSETAPLVLSD